MRGCRQVSDAQQLVALLLPAADRLARAPTLRDFRQRHAALSTSAPGVGSASAAAAAAALPSVAHVAEALLLVAGRLRLVAPRLRLRPGKDEAAGGPFGWGGGGTGAS
jgi:type II secretory pathway component PulM